jgi:hypothetical protein
MKMSRKGNLVVMPVRRAMAAPEPVEEPAMTCANCGAPELVEIERSAATGVTAPDGGQEYRLERTHECLACGHVEEA